MAGDTADKTLVLELANSNAGKGAVETETVNEDRLGDELVGRNFLEHTFIGLLVEDDHVVGLVLDLLSGPLLLGLLASGGRGGLGSCVLLCLLRS
jgi:predicted small integral membrane protein